MRFEYKFHDKGLNLSEIEIPDNEIYLDIGNDIGIGVIDHHQLQLPKNEKTCTVKELVENIHLLDGLKGKEAVVFHTHEHPDTDALFAICLSRYYLNPQNIWPLQKIDDIIEFVLNVDIGKITIKDDKTITLYKLICFLEEKYWDNKKINDIVEKYACLIETVIKANENVEGFSFMESDVIDFIKKHSNDFKGISEFKAKKDKIIEDFKRYEDDWEKERCYSDKANIYLTSSEGSCEHKKAVPALIWKEPTECMFNRLWARNDGFILTVVPQKSKKYYWKGKEFDCTVTTISIPEDKCDEYSLVPLANILEQYEQDRELEVLGEGNSKRDHSSPRGKVGDGNRFFKKPWARTSDPWYFHPDGTLVESPRSGSLLTTEEVIGIVKTFAKCYVKKHKLVNDNDGVPEICMNVLVPFTFSPSDKERDKFIKWLKAREWKRKDIEEIHNDKEPLWMIKDDGYLSPLIRDYRKSKQHFDVFKHDNSWEVMKVDKKDNFGNPSNICGKEEDGGKHNKTDKHCIFKEQDAQNNEYYRFEKECYIVLFKFGVGILILKQPSIFSDELFASSEIDRLNKRQDILNEHFINYPIFSQKKKNPDDAPCLDFRGLAPHFYTSIEVSSECWNVSNSLILKYAKQICDVFDNNEKTCKIEKISDRAIMASSRMGVALVIATDKFDDKEKPEENTFDKLESNKLEYGSLRKFSNGWFFMYLIALQQRYSLIEIKRSFTLLEGGKNSLSRKILSYFGIDSEVEVKRKNLRETLIKFYATSYFTTATDDEQGDNIYRIWHDALIIKDLKTDIMEQINQHDEYQSKKLTSFIEKASIALIAIALFEALANVESTVWKWDVLRILGALGCIALACIIISGVAGVLRRGLNWFFGKNSN